MSVYLTVFFFSLVRRHTLLEFAVRMRFKLECYIIASCSGRAALVVTSLLHKRNPTFLDTINTENRKRFRLTRMTEVVGHRPDNGSFGVSHRKIRKFWLTGRCPTFLPRSNGNAIPDFPRRVYERSTSGIHRHIDLVSNRWASILQRELQCRITLSSSSSSSSSFVIQQSS